MRDRKPAPWWAVAAMFVLIPAAFVLGVVQNRQSSEAQSTAQTAVEQKDQAETQRDATAYQALALASDAFRACSAGDVPAAYSSLCELAARVQAEPVPGAPGVPGPRGPVGPAGVQGVPGEPGATGPAGPAGSPGATGATGPAGQDGTNGADGAAGPQGPAGPQGEPGDPACTPPAQVEPYVFPDLRPGYRCVTPEG